MKTSFVFLASLLVAACSGSSSNDVLDPPGTATDKNDPAASSTSTTKTDPPTEDPAKKDDPKKDDPPVTTSVPATPADCDAFAAKFCPKADACNHIVSIVLGAECEERVAGLCKSHLAAPGTGMTTAALTQCGNAYTTLTCAEAFGAVQPPGCAFKGTLTANTPCAFDDQCTSGTCGGNEDNTCGTCSAKTSTPTVKPTANLGETCDNAGQSAPQCNTSLGLWCNDATSTCEKIPTVGIGQACGFVGESLVLCNAGLACKSGTNGSGTCIATKAVGAACTKPNGFDDCAFGTACLSGTCAYPTAAAICK